MKARELAKIFKSKKLVYTRKFKPGVLQKVFVYKNVKFARIGFPNLIKFHGYLPITDVPFKSIVAISKLPSPFKKWLYRQFGLKAKGTYYIIKRN